MARHLWQGACLPIPVVVGVVLVICVLVSGASPSVSAKDEPAVRGSAIAAEKCGKCHGVGVADASPHKITPPLRDLAKWYPVAMLVESLETGSLSGHDEMPQFDLGPEDARALVAYIDSLNPKGPHYLKGGK